MSKQCNLGAVGYDMYERRIQSLLQNYGEVGVASGQMNGKHSQRVMGPGIRVSNNSIDSCLVEN